MPQATLASLIAHMPGMTLSGYEYQISHSVGTGVSAFVDSSTAGEVADTMSLAEHDIYGSSRLGVQTYDWGAVKNIWKYGTTTATDSSMSGRAAWYSFAYGDLIDRSKTEPWGNGDTSIFTVTRLLGKRYYEITDHLGNVLVTVLDRKTGHVNAAIPTLYDYYSADIASAQDYYPGGFVMPGRSKDMGLTSRYNYNGQLRDDEVYGKGDLNSALFWEMDTRINRRWNKDPVINPSESPYTVFNDNPIIKVDINGNNAKVKSEEVDNKTTNVNVATTVYVVGEDAEKKAASYQKLFDEAEKKGEFKGVIKKDDHTYNMSVSIRFVAGTDADKRRIEQEAIDGKPSGDSYFSLNKTGQMEGQALSLKRLVQTNGYLRATYLPAPIMMAGIVSMTNYHWSTPIHEALHLLGLTDRYSMPSKEGEPGISWLGYESNYMGANEKGASELSQDQWCNWFDYIQRNQLQNGVITDWVELSNGSVNTRPPAK